jgi:hypothetical protein
VREADLEGHFTHEDTGSDKPTAKRDAAAGSDLQLARALEVLKSWTYFDRLHNTEKPSTLHARSLEGETAAATP